MRIRRLTALLTICGAVLAAGGCGSTAAAVDTGSAPLSLTIWVDEKRAPAVKEAADRFAAESGITVATEVVAKDLQTTFVTAAQAGKGPDLVLGAHDWIGNLVQNGTIDPLQMTDAQKARFEPLAIKGVTYNGQIYGVPFAVANVVLIRNTDLSPEAPKTMES
jgi:arabinogalactan oligomer/maltooligosaccharide transport system substrate-binding protein